MARKAERSKTGKRIAIIDGCRVPFQRSGTGYYDIMAWELGRYAVKGLLAKTGVSPEDIDHVLMGCVATDIATTNVAREVALGAGLPKKVPAHTCTIACVSANAAFTNGANLIETGNADVIVIGGGAVGENVADYATKQGLRVTIVESELVGGECSYWACMPSKACSLYTSDAADELPCVNPGGTRIVEKNKRAR